MRLNTFLNELSEVPTENISINGWSLHDLIYRNELEYIRFNKVYTYYEVEICNETFFKIEIEWN